MAYEMNSIFIVPNEDKSGNHEQISGMTETAWRNENGLWLGFSFEYIRKVLAKEGAEMMVVTPDDFVWIHVLSELQVMVEGNAAVSER